jgi:hypothetical protein
MKLSELTKKEDIAHLRIGNIRERPDQIPQKGRSFLR